VLNPMEPRAAGPRTLPTRIDTSIPSALPLQVLPSSNRDFRPRSCGGIARPSGAGAGVQALGFVWSAEPAEAEEQVSEAAGTELPGVFLPGQRPATLPTCRAQLADGQPRAIAQEESVELLRYGRGSHLK
jgi:hypothetical protein